jgi:hypothetical protein
MMQNWEHTQVCNGAHGYKTLIANVMFSLSFPTSTNFQKSRTTQTFPASSRGTWMDSRCFVVGHVAEPNTFCSAAFLRQTVLLSAYETPEIRGLYNESLRNLAGKMRTLRRWAPVQVPEGLDQVSTSLQGAFDQVSRWLAELYSV